MIHRNGDVGRTAELTLTKGDLAATLLVAPARVGPVDIAIDLSTSNGDALTVKAVRISPTPLGGEINLLP